MFRFNFQSEDDEDTSLVIGDQQDRTDKSCEKVSVSDTHQEFIFKPILIENVEFFVRDFDTKDDEENEDFMKWYKNCDVIPSIYEGGLKIWECTYDLLIFLMSNDTNFKNKTVLDLGCGCGMIGIFAGKRGAKTVHFQDYNEGVLSAYTIPNVHRNKIKSEIEFFKGDWSSFAHSSFIESVEYDYILTSETLYNPSNYSKLFDLFSRKLKNGGEIYVASKSYYFGVGGSVQKFQELANQRHTFSWESVWKTDKGVQREIIRLTMKSS